MKKQLTLAEQRQLAQAKQARTLDEAIEATPKSALEQLTEIDPAHPEEGVAGDLFDSPLFAGN